MTTSGEPEPPLVARPIPDTDASFAMGHGFVHRQELWSRLLPGHNDIHTIIGFEAMVTDPQQRICVRRQIDARNISLLVGHQIQNPGS